jgi:hypothetical protein
MRTETLWDLAVTGGESGGGPRPPRHLLIISRYHPALYDYVRARFASEGGVEVILDRRRGRERRTGEGTSAVERRFADRRVRPQVDMALRMESMQFVTIAPSAAGSGPRGAEGDPTERSR